MKFGTCESHSRIKAKLVTRRDRREKSHVKG
jgi:hypothetical protein